MNKGTLKAKATKTVSCEICGSKVTRTKTFKVVVLENETEKGKVELQKKADNWELTEKQKHCHICWSIVKG